MKHQFKKKKNTLSRLFTGPQGLLMSNYVIQIQVKSIHHNKKPLRRFEGSNDPAQFSPKVDYKVLGGNNCK